MSITESKLEKVHIFPSEDSYKTNINSVGGNDLALVPIDNIITDLNNKADRDLSNVTKPYVTETWKSDDGSSWYRKWSDGWIEQGGCYGSWTGNPAITITLNTPFTTTTYFAVACTNGTTLDEHTGQYFINSKLSSSFIFQPHENGRTGMYWYACGH